MFHPIFTPEHTTQQPTLRDGTGENHKKSLELLACLNSSKIQVCHGPYSMITLLHPSIIITATGFALDLCNNMTVIA